jgi:hypothetical protein
VFSRGGLEQDSKKMVDGKRRDIVRKDTKRLRLNFVTKISQPPSFIWHQCILCTIIHYQDI